MFKIRINKNAKDVKNLKAIFGDVLQHCFLCQVDCSDAHHLLLSNMTLCKLSYLVVAQFWEKQATNVIL